MVNRIERAIKDQLEEYAKHLILSKSAGRQDNVLLVKSQIDAYRIGLETCLNKDFVNKMFCTYGF
jgi:hypothetical protein